MKEKHKTIIACTAYLVLIFIFAFFLSSIKNHSYVLGKYYIAAEEILFRDYITEYFIEFFKEYYKTLLLFLMPLLFVNYVFVNALIRMTGKDVFNCIVSTILILCVFEWASFYINQGSNLFQIAMFGIFLLFVVIMEFIFRLCSRSKLSFIYPFAIGITINMYYGIFILSNPYKMYNFVPLLILVVTLYFIRCFLSLLSIDGKKRKILIGIIIMLTFILLIVIFGTSWYDYSTNDPHHKVWQQLYYVAVYSSFFETYIMPYLTKVLYIGGSSIEEIEGKRKLALIFNAILLTIIPILCIYAVHGVVLIISNGIILLINFFLVLKKPVISEKGESNVYLAPAILTMIITYIYMAIDPILYFNASQYISMLWPLIGLPGIIGGTAIALYQLLNLPDKKIKKSFSVIFNKIKGSFDIKIQVILCAVNFIILGIFYIVYEIKNYANEERGNLNVAYIDLHLEGFGGLYLFSWCMVPIYINSLAFLISAAFSITKEKEVKKCQLK